MSVDTSEITYLDVETTGLYPTQDRVVQVAISQGLKKINLTLNPQQAIPEDVIKIHGITNEMVVGKPTFMEIHQSLIPYFDIRTCKYICGYNVAFDFKFLQMEFSKCGLFLESSSYKFLDPLAIHKRLCPNDLASMYRRYTGKELQGGHDAEVDMKACLEILEQQQIRTKKTPEELSELSGLSNKTIGGWLERTDVGYKFLMGKYIGEELNSVKLKDEHYVHWVLGLKDISFEEQLILRKLV